MRYFKVVTLLVGALLLFWIIRKLGIQELLNGFHLLGWKMVVPILIITPCYLLYTISWKLFLQRFDEHSIPYWTLFRIKVAGESTNTLTPLNFAGGDPVRIWLLSRFFPPQISGASVVVDRTLQILAIVTTVFLGNLAALFMLDFPAKVRILLGSVAGLLLVVVLFFIFHQTRGLFQKLLRLSHKFHIKSFSEMTIKKVEELDGHIGNFYRRDRPLFVFCYFLHLLARLTGIAEIYCVARFLGVPMTLWGAVFFAAVIPMTNMVGGIVPGTLGILEGVMSSLFFVLHWNPAAGIVLQIVRRIRAFFWVLVGLLFLFLFKTKEKNKEKIS